MHSESFGKFRGKVVNMKRFIMTTLVVLSAISAIFASTYIIDRYDFNFEGKTDVNEVYKYLNISDGTSFDSYDKLEANARSMVQKLVNAKFFTSVDYRIVEADGNAEGAEELHYTAVYNIDDKSPYFVLPKPKYDSNYGFNVGIKADSYNFLGKLARLTIDASLEQKEKSFEKATYKLDFNVVKFPVSTFDLDATLSFAYDGSKEGLKGTTMGLSSKIYNIKVINNVTFSFSTGLKFTPSTDSLQSFGLNEFTYTAQLNNFLNSLGKMSVSHSLTYQPRDKKVKTSNTLYYYGFKLMDKQITTTISMSTEKVLEAKTTAMTVSETVSVPFSLPLNFSLTPSMSVSTSYTTDGTLNLKNWTIKPRTATLKATLTRSKINKLIEGNTDFKKGLYISVTATRTTLLENLLNDPNQNIVLSTTWYPYANSWFNPSTRINAKIQNKQATVTTTAGYMRGIRDDNVDSKTNKWTTVAVANVNLTTKCINLGSWARTYAIPFVDVAYLKNSETNIEKALCTVGIEGIGIINNHPNYPVRASLGFNTESIKKYAETKNFKDLEYELFIGLDFFY